MALVLTHVLNNLWLMPLMNLTYGLLDILLTPFSFFVR
jgi:hypothetical protein